MSASDSSASDSSTECKTYTMSMTRANKILGKLRDVPGKSKKTKHYTYTTEKVYSTEVNLLTYSYNSTRDMLKEIQENVETKLARSILIEKWKNKLFELNIRYGIHEVMSQIELLKEEKTVFSEILAEYQATRFIGLDQVHTSILAVTSSDKKYEFKWQVSPFDINSIKKKLVTIGKQINKLEAQRDELNIQNSFTVELDPTEREFADLE